MLRHQLALEGIGRATVDFGDTTGAVPGPAAEAIYRDLGVPEAERLAADLARL